jgi:hypothetical protein
MSGTCYFPPTSLFVLFHHRLPSLRLSRSRRKKTLKNLFFIKPKKLRLCKAAAPKYLPVYVLTSARQAHHPSAHPTTPSAIDQPIPYQPDASDRFALACPALAAEKTANSP